MKAFLNYELARAGGTRRAENAHFAGRSGRGRPVGGKTHISIELELISGVANPKGGNRALSIRIRGRCIFHVFDGIRAYLWCGEPEGGKPNALYQNPCTISLFAKTA